MRKVFLIMLVLLLLGGCGVKGEDAVLPENEKVVTESNESSFSVSEIYETEKEVVDTAVDNVAKPKTEPEDKKATVVQKKSEVQENTSSSGSKNNAEDDEEVITDEESSEVNPDETEIEEVTEEPILEVDESPDEPEKEKEPKVVEKHKTAYDYDFDMAKIRSDCIAIGKSMGLAHDSSLTPKNATWWNPVTASESNQGMKLKNRLESYIRFHTLENLSSYGIDEINYFNIYTESVGGGKYKIYFIFA